MRIIIPDDMGNDARFAEWLVEEIKQELIVICDEHKFDVISEYLNMKLDVHIDIYEVFLEILNSIRILHGRGLAQIVISNRVLYNDNRLTTQSLAKLIDVGNIEIRGTHIFSTVFNRVRSNLNKYLTKYMFENGGI